MHEEDPQLCEALVSMQVVTGNGSIVEVSGEEASLAAVHLGMLGPVVRLRLRVVPQYDISVCVYEGMHLDNALAKYPDMLSRSYSLSFFTQWRSCSDTTCRPDEGVNIWFKTTDRKCPGVMHGTELAARPLHPISSVDPSACVLQNISGPSHERLPHFKYVSSLNVHILQI